MALYYTIVGPFICLVDVETSALQGLPVGGFTAIAFDDQYGASLH
jgi:hypothetical protein